jgi:hypothetical protein
MPKALVLPGDPLFGISNSCAAQRTLRAAPSLPCVSVLSPSRLAPLVACPFTPPIEGERCDAVQVLTFHTKAWSSFAPPTCRMPPGPSGSKFPRNRSGACQVTFSVVCRFGQGLDRTSARQFGLRHFLAQRNYFGHFCTSSSLEIGRRLEVPLFGGFADPMQRSPPYRRKNCHTELHCCRMDRRSARWSDYGKSTPANLVVDLQRYISA